MVTLTHEEWDALGDPEHGGSLAKQKAHQAEEAKIVFGTDFKSVKGKPVEQGIGSPGRETPNHLNAIRKYEGEEAYKKAVAEAEARKKKG